MTTTIDFIRRAGLAALVFAAVACGGPDADPAAAPPPTQAVAPAPDALAGEAVRVVDAGVAMPDIHSAEAARDVLNAGGNAVDAAVAASFVLAVTLPEAGNIGGGGFMTLFMDGETDFVDYRETAPAAATRDMYLDENGEFTGDASRVGVLAAGVPGTVSGLAAAHAKYGRLPWAGLVAPAIALARDGFETHEKLAANIARKAERLDGRTNFSDYFAAAAGETLRQPELAATLERIAADGPDGFYAGKTAELIADYMAANDGLITVEDLAAYEAKFRSPIEFDWNGRRVVAPPPPSSGGVALKQLLLMRDALGEEFEGVEHNSPQYVHLIAEIEKRVFADRAEYLGDPDFYDVPTGDLLDPAYIARRAAEVNPDAISPTPDVKPGLPESPQTTHFSIVDFDGGAASVTTTLNTSFGAAVVVEGAGFLLNNEMDDFSAKPGEPNFYGVVGAEANAIAPGKRMLSSMTPTIVLEAGRVAMVVGTPGGPTIFTSVYQAILNHAAYGMSAADAVAAGRFHHQLLPKDTVFMETRVGGFAETKAALEERGYRIVERGGYGDVHAVTVDADGETQAAHDPRNRGASLVLDRAGD